MEQNLRGFIFIRFMAPFGTIAMAAHTIVGRVEVILFMPTFGLGMAAGVLTGQSLGAKRPDRAEKSGWLAAGLIEAFIFVVCITLFVWAEFYVRIFTSDPALIEMSSSFIRIAVAGYIIIGIAAVCQQCIISAGDTILPMVVSLVSGWLIQLPLAYFMPKIGDLGVYGVRWAVMIPTVLGAIVYKIYFRMGRWKRKEV